MDDDKVGKQLVELQNREVFKSKFASSSLTEFWAYVRTKEPNLSELAEAAVKVLLPFPTTYLCEADFLPLLSLNQIVAIALKRQMIFGVHFQILNRIYTLWLKESKAVDRTSYVILFFLCVEKVFELRIDEGR